MTDLIGNITFISNLYPVEKNILTDDIKFCQHIEDPEMIKEMKMKLIFQNFPFTKKQESIFRVQSGWYCRLNKEDMPFGAIYTSDGLIKEICRCKNTDCKFFEKCIKLNDITSRYVKEEIASSQNINSIKEEETVCVKSSDKNNKTNKTFSTKVLKTQNEKTERGIQIQKQLESLKYEIKRKDLNPIEKEYLQKDLLKLKKEIIDERDKFSKADDIQTRLQSIEINLNKLKESEDEFLERKIEKKVEPVVVNEDNSVTVQGKSPKKGRNTIKLFSLSQ